MEEKYEVTFETKLTNEIIDKLVQHQTLSSLRRACAISPCIFKADDVENMPIIYYVMDPETKEWTLHALTSDLITFLLKGQAEDGGGEDGGDDQPVAPTHDGTIEITSPEGLVAYTDSDSDGRIDIPNEATSDQAVTIGVKITMNNTEGTFTGEFYTGETMPENPGQMTVQGNVLTADVELEANTEKGTPIMFKVTDANSKEDTFVIGYGSAN